MGLTHLLKQPLWLAGGGRNRHPCIDRILASKQQKLPCLPEQTRCVGGQEMRRKSKEA